MAGAALAVTATAVMVGVTLPGEAGAGERDTGGARNTAQRAAQERTGPGGAGEAEGRIQGQGAVAPGAVEPPADEGERGTGSDPLTGDEMERAARIALDRRTLRSAQDVDGDRGPQRLSVELSRPDTAERDARAPRRADVTFYDYEDDTLITRTVDLSTGTVARTGTQRGVQPPLSRAEQAEAARLLIADPLGAGLKADYQDATGRKLASPDQLELFAMVYRAAPGAQPRALDRCGEHRCARLFPKVANGPWIDARHLVIDLSSREVAALDRD
nr:Tat pathway signal sequence domain protein [Streptomyces harenosi]